MPGGPGRPPGPPYGSPPPKSNTGLIVGLLAGAGLLIVVALVVVVVVARGGNDSKEPTASGGRSPRAGSNGGVVPAGQLRPSDYDDNASWSLWNPLDDRTDDPDAMTVSEVFDDPESRNAEGSDKKVYSLQGLGRMDTDCAQAVWGDGLKAALQGYGCTQVARGVYADETKRIAGHVAVFNLRDVTSADQFIKDLDPAQGKGFVTPLPGQSSPLDRFGSGFTGADGGAYGHFVVVSWVGFTDGTSGDSASIDTIAPRSAVERAAKNFLFPRLTKAR
ncbi:MAG TPA: hypothetical protein VGP70_12405 [Actinomadura sp.]|jgi:hypothetical protein|nr:hypothetical protein [Actinomadura sp.]